MKEQNDNKIIIVLLVIIILLLSVLLGLTLIGKLNSKNGENVSNSTTKQANNESTVEENVSTNESVDESTGETNISGNSYTKFIGNWYNSETNNELKIKNITDNEITFTWFLYRLAGIDDDTTISFNNGKGSFYFQGLDGDEMFTRKATIELTDNGVNVKIEDVNIVDNSYGILDNFSGSVYVKAGIYTHPLKK